jgi:hypothetical protein
VLRALTAAAAVLLSAAACTSSRSSPSGTPQTTATRTVIHTTVPSTAPVVAGPTSSKEGNCPFIAKQTVAEDLGMRLERTTVQHSGGKTVGCEFFALQDSPLATSERLPGPKQPVLRVLTVRYPSATAAHNAMVRLADAGKNAQQVKITTKVTGLAYQTDFYPADRGHDWAVAISTGAMLITIETVVTSPSLSAVTLARHLFAKFR